MAEQSKEMTELQAEFDSRRLQVLTDVAGGKYQERGLDRGILAKTLYRMNEDGPGFTDCVKSGRWSNTYLLETDDLLAPDLVAWLRIHDHRVLWINTIRRHPAKVYQIALLGADPINPED